MQPMHAQVCSAEKFMGVEGYRSMVSPGARYGVFEGSSRARLLYGRKYREEKLRRNEAARADRCRSVRIAWNTCDNALIDSERCK
jgi:hypothetical protein